MSLKGFANSWCRVLQRQEVSLPSMARQLWEGLQDHGPGSIRYDPGCHRFLPTWIGRHTCYLPSATSARGKSTLCVSRNFQSHAEWCAQIGTTGLFAVAVDDTHPVDAKALRPHATSYVMIFKMLTSWHVEMLLPSCICKTLQNCPQDKNEEELACMPHQ